MNKCSIFCYLFFLYQSTEVKSSNNMETEGLKRSFDHLQGWGFCPHVLVTDCHFGVNALMKSNYPNTKHRFDAWHVAKGNIILPNGLRRTSDAELSF